MNKLLIIPVIAGSLTAYCAPLKPPTAYMNAKEAIAAHPDFTRVGEYIAKDEKSALQANQLPDSTFLVAEYAGGLPGAGWNQSPIQTSIKTTKELETALKAFRPTERTSPTLGKQQPADAILRFPEDFTKVKDGLMQAGGKTTKELGSFHLHLEFLLPFKPGKNPSSQDRGNSGIYIFNNYEIQVIDSFGLDLEMENNAIKTESLNSQWCGALYKLKPPDVHMAYPPLHWQTYDIDFHAPIFEAGKKVKNARITVRHNGVLIHDDFELKTGTGSGAKKKQLAAGPIFFQAHANPVVYRNVWAVEL